MKKVLLGSHAVSYGVQLCRAQVVSAYPITPQTHIVEELSEMCRDGRLNARFIKVESEHSAMACILGAASAGARVFTATSSHGLALMHEVLHWAAGSRLPIVLANVNRAIGPPWSIMPDQGDSLAQRDTGWIQLFTESGQEAMDTIIQAYKIAEEVLLPVMVNLDGFFLSHTSEVVDLPEQDAVDAFLPPFDPPFKLDTDDPRTFGALCADDRYAGFRYDMQKAMDRAREITEETDEAFGETFERRYFGPVESYKLDEAETALVTSGTITGSARVAVDRLRDRGEAVGLLKIRQFRPFPIQRVREALAGVERIAVIDRNCSFGMGGGFASELKAALYNMEGGRPPVFGYVAGIGGVDVTPEGIEELVRRACSEKTPEREDIWVGVRT